MEIMQERRHTGETHILIAMVKLPLTLGREQTQSSVGPTYVSSENVLQSTHLFSKEHIE
jgi:hypothetical protein